ncbi:MAG: stealth family protein [Eubacteriales bacterium]
MSDGIDFVVLWVDGNDRMWQRERAAYVPAVQDNGSDENRFRDWNLMRYWFRGAERYAPWVRYIWFVTNGQKPAWLNIGHPKLRCVSHEDYIPEPYLPTFNSNVIELWLHRIPALSERFVLFNDDMFLTAPTAETDFFRDGLPCESALLDMPSSPDPDDCLPHMLINNAAILNRHFSKHSVLKQNFRKFFSLRYGTDLLRNVLLAPFRYFSAFRDPHLPSSYLKRTFETVWAAEEERLLSCAGNRFRSKSDYTHWLMKCWQLCEGRFAVRGTDWGHHFELWEDDLDAVCRAVTERKYRAVCINDSKPDIDFEMYKTRLKACFEAAFPDPSSFETETDTQEA